MNFLLIDTTHDSLLVATSTQGKILSKFGADDKAITSSTLFPTITQVVEMAGLQLKDFDAIFCVVGPGSFTGIRIGVCATMAMSTALNLPAVDLTVFDGFGSADLCVIPSHRGSYYSFANGEFGEITHEELLSHPEFLYKFASLEKGRLVSDDEYVSNLFAVGIAKFNSGKINKIQPLYLKKSQAERLREQNK